MTPEQIFFFLPFPARPTLSGFFVGPCVFVCVRVGVYVTHSNYLGGIRRT